MHMAATFQIAGGTLWYELVNSGTAAAGSSRTGTEPAGFRLIGNYPNPFNPSTTIQFFSDQTGKAALTVYDTNGRELLVQALEVEKGQTHRCSVNLNRIPSGVYCYKIKLPDGAGKMGKMMLLK